MNAAETIQAAIEKLEGLRAESSPGPWNSFRGSLQGGGGEWDNLLEAGDFAASSEEFINSADPGLIVTLHRTIDAQLAILREAETWGISDATIDLARAILGEAS